MNRFLIFIVAGLAGALFADKKGRDKLTWFILCLLFPPMVLALLILPPKLAEGRTKRCPHCSNIVSQKDSFCKFCKKELPIEMVKCRSCGSFVPDKEFCMQCNRKLK